MTVVQVFSFPVTVVRRTKNPSESKGRTWPAKADRYGVAWRHSWIAESQELASNRKELSSGSLTLDEEAGSVWIMLQLFGECLVSYSERKLWLGHQGFSQKTNLPSLKISRRFSHRMSESNSIVLLRKKNWNSEVAMTQSLPFTDVVELRTLTTNAIANVMTSRVN